MRHVVLNVYVAQRIFALQPGRAKCEAGGAGIVPLHWGVFGIKAYFVALPY